VRGDGKKPLVARFGGIPLVRNQNAILVDENPTPVSYERKEVVRRLIASRCELCESKDEHCVVHPRTQTGRTGRDGKSSTALGADHAQETTQNPDRLPSLS
jgi:hypothetical protein